MLNPFVEKYHDKLARLYRSYSWLGMSPEEIAVMEFIEESMAKPKRPPLKWDGKKPLPFTWGLYRDSQLEPNVTSYNINEGWYKYTNGFVETTIDASFCVKRLS